MHTIGKKSPDTIKKLQIFDISDIRQRGETNSWVELEKLLCQKLVKFLHTTAGHKYNLAEDST